MDNVTKAQLYASSMKTMLGQAELERTSDIHKTKIRTVKSCIDNSTPKFFHRCMQGMFVSLMVPSPRPPRAPPPLPVSPPRPTMLLKW